MAETPADAHRALLVVDADMLVRRAIADYLRGCGYSVLEAASSDQAVALLGDPETRVDAVLCDVAINGSLSAFELCIWTKENRPGINVILAGSVPAAAGAAAELCDQGPQLQRPYDPETVVDLIRKRLGQRDAPAT